MMQSIRTAASAPPTCPCLRGGTTRALWTRTSGSARGGYRVLRTWSTPLPAGGSTRGAPTGGYGGSACLEGAVEDWTRTSGRPLGVALAGDGSLVVADADKVS